MSLTADEIEKAEKWFRNTREPFPLLPYEWMSPEQRDLYHEYWDNRKMKKFECSSCEFCKNGSRYGYICTHDKVEHHAKLYEVKTNKRISKSKNFIGFKMPKTCLKWCPLKES